MSTKLVLIGYTVLVVALAGNLNAATFKQAQVTQIQNDVRTITPPSAVRPSKLNETITANQGLRTGTKSRAELIFPDFSLTRLGANTIFSFEPGTREAELQQGTILFHVPKGSGGVKIRTAAINAAIAGTTGYFEYSPQANVIKFGILEGRATLFIKGRLGQSMGVGPGEMVIVSPTVTNFNSTEVVHFDIKKFVATCKLITEMGGLPQLSEQRITVAEANQARDLTKTKTLAETNLVIPGPGNQVFILSQVDQRMEVLKAIAGVAPTPVPSTAPGPTPSKFGTVQTIAGRYTIKNNTTIQTDPTITTDRERQFGKIYRGSVEDGRPTNFVFGLGVTPDPVFDDEFAKLNQPAVFRFEDLHIEASPVVDTRGGTKDLVLAASGAITSGGAGPQTLDFSNLHTLTLAAIGPIGLAPELTIQGLESQLWLYTRGAGSDITVDSTIVLPGADFRIDAGGGLSLGGNVTFENGDWSSSGNMQITGSVDASGSLKLDSSADITLAGSMAASTLEISGRDITTSGDLSGTSVSGRKLNFDGAATFTGDVTSEGTADGTSLSGNNLTFGDAANFSGNVTSKGTVSATSLKGNNLTFGGNATVTGDVNARGAVLALGSITGVNLSGNTLDFRGPASFSGDVFATGSFVAHDTFKANVLDAATIRFAATGLDPSRLNQSDGFLTFAGPINTRVNASRTTALAVSSPLEIFGDISLGQVDLNFAGNIDALGGDGTTDDRNNISARNLTVSSVNAINGGDIGLFATLALSINGRLIADKFTAEANSISGNLTSSLIDAVNVILRAGVPTTFNQTTSNRVNFESLPIDTFGLVSLELQANPLQFTGDIFLESANLTLGGNVEAIGATNSIRAQNLTVSNVNAINGGDIGLFASQTLSINGRITATGFTAEASSISGNLASSLIDAVNVTLRAETLTAFSQPSPDRANFDSLPIDLTGTTSLLLEAGPLQLTGDISLGERDLTLAGNAEAVGAINSISARNLTVTNLTGNELLLNATGDISIAGTVAVGLISAFAQDGILGVGPSALIDAEGVNLRAGTLVTLSQPATTNRVNFGSLPIDLTRTSLLDLGAGPLQISGDISLTAADLNLAGDVHALGDNPSQGNTMRSRNLAITNLTAVNGGDISLFASEDISINGRVTARNFVADAGGEILADPNLASIDAVDVTLRTGSDIVASLSSLPIDFTRTVRLNLTANALQLTGSIDIGQRDLNLTSETQIIVGNTIFRSGVWTSAGNMEIAGLTNASNSLELVAGGNISVTGTLAADQLNLSASGEILRGVSTGVLDARILILASGQPADFGVVSESEFLEFGPESELSTVLIDQTRLSSLNLTASPLRLTSSISLPNLDLTLAGMIDAQGNDIDIGDRDLTIGNLTNGGSISAASILPANRGSGGSNSITTQAALVPGGLRFLGANGTSDTPPEDGSNLTLTFQSTTLPFNVEGENFNGGDALSGSGNVGGSGGTYFLTSPQSILTGVITATTGRNSNSTMTGGRGGTVDVTSQSGSISVNFPIEVSSNDPGDRRKSASGGTIRLRSGLLTGTAINVTNSGDLRALLDSAAPGPGGAVEIVSAGGQIIVEGKATANRGVIDIRNNGPAPSPTPQIALNGATLSADIVKVGALGNNGELRVGGGSISANTTLRLYAGGTNGTVNFVDNVSLNGNSVKTIAGRTVRIDNTKTVTVNGRAATVFTDNPHYTGSGGNGSTTGTFAGSGASTLPFNHSTKPGFDD